MHARGWGKVMSEDPGKHIPLPRFQAYISGVFVYHLNEDFAKTKAGDSILGDFTVISHVNNALILQFRKENWGAVGLARVRFQLRDQIRIQNEDITFDDFDLLSVMLDAHIDIPTKLHWDLDGTIAFGQATMWVVLLLI
jgi:hypothetical protein